MESGGGGGGGIGVRGALRARGRGDRECEAKEEVGSKGMSETRAEDMTPLTERKSINSCFFTARRLRRGAAAESAI